MVSSSTYRNFINLSERLIVPPVIGQSVEDRLQMRLISSLFLVQIIVTLFTALLYTSIEPDSIAIPAALAFGSLSLLCYGVSRTRFYMVSAFAYIVLMIVMLFALFLTNQQNPNAIPEYTLSYLAVVIFFTSLLLSVRTTLVVAIIVLVGIGLIPLVVDELLFPVHFAWLFVFVTSVLIVITGLIRRNVLKRLQESENHARNLMEAYIDAVAIQSEQNKILAINPAFTTLLGYRSTDILNTSLIALACDDPSQRSIDGWMMLDTKSDPFEVTLRHRNGETITVEMIIQPYDYNGQPAHVFVARDMRKYKEALRKKHEQEIRYQSLLDMTDDAVIITNLDGDYIAVNQHASEILKAPADEIVGKSYRDFVPEVYHDASRSVFRRVSSGEHIPMYERTFIRANGQRFPAEVMVHLLHDVDGNPQYIHSIIRDISERKRAEEHRLELAIERERMATLQQFLSDASHYFRTPLTSIKTSQYLLTQITDNPQKQAEFLNIIKLEVARLEHLIGDMMMSTQLESDTRNAMTFGRINVADVLPEAVSTFSPSEKRDEYAGIVIEPDIRPRTLYIMGSRAKLMVAIHRLLENAVTYSPPDSTVTVGVYQQEENVCIEIRDEGIGITAEEMPLLFQRFRRADRAIEMAHVGNGLGLFIAQKIVEIHYGEIRVESEPDKGSTFTICLPMALSFTSKDKTKPSKQDDEPQFV